MLFYLVAYLFMNLGAFAIVAFLRNTTRSEDLADFRGLVRRSPVLVVTLAFFLLSLLGLPPLVGFAAKFQIFKELYDQGQLYYQHNEPGLGLTLFALLLVGGVNTVLSAFYYIKVLKVMTLDTPLEDLEGREAPELRVPVLPVVYAVLMAVATLGLGVLWGPLANFSKTSVERFRLRPGEDIVRASAVPPGARMGPAGGMRRPGGRGGGGQGKQAQPEGEEQ
jgi:NADH-quinone oxidoreductase subunit N